MLKLRGIAGAAGSIILGVAMLLGLFWVIGNPAVIDHVNGWMLMGGFLFLLVAALYAAWRKASLTSPEAPHAAGTKAVGVQILRGLLMLAGIIGLIILIGVSVS